MGENTIGWLIIILSVISVGVVAAIAGLRWGWRWDVESYDGHRLRFDHGAVSTPAIRAEVKAAVEAFRLAVSASPYRLIVGRYLELNEWWIEVVPVGKVKTPSVPFGRLPGGGLVGGSIRRERLMWPVPGRWVAVVVQERTGAFILHEATRHIAAMVLYRNPDAPHERKNLEELETDAKRRYAELLAK